MAERGASLLKRAAAFCSATVGWNAFAGGAAVVTAAAIGSLALIGFGVNAVVDSSVSALLAWRFRAEASGRRVSVERVLEAAGSLVFLPYLALGKYRLSTRLGSPALRADSLPTVSGIALAGIALGGLLAERCSGGWPIRWLLSGSGAFSAGRQSAPCATHATRGRRVHW